LLFRPLQKTKLTLSSLQVMEAGETDLNTLLASHAGKPVSLNFIRYIWEQVRPLLSLPSRALLPP